MSTSKIFDIPKYYYFKAGNNYLGSLNGMNFKIDNGENLVVYLYRGMKCFELSEPYSQESFPNSEVGYSQLIEWLEKSYLEHQNTEYFTKRIHF